MMTNVDHSAEPGMTHDQALGFLAGLRDLASPRGEQPQLLPLDRGVVFENCTFGSNYGTGTIIEIHGQPSWSRFRSIESVSGGGTVVTMRTGIKQRIADIVAGVRATARRKWKERR